MNLGSILHFFKGLGHRVRQGLSYIAEHITEEQLQRALTLVLTAEDKFFDNAQRRDYVVKALQQVPGVNENIARILTEMAVGLVQKQLHKVTEEAIAPLVP